MRIMYPLGFLRCCHGFIPGFLMMWILVGGDPRSKQQRMMLFGYFYCNVNGYNEHPIKPNLVFRLRLLVS